MLDQMRASWNSLVIWLREVPGLPRCARIFFSSRYLQHFEFFPRSPFEGPAGRAPVGLLTAALQEDHLVEALQLGVGGVVLKEMAPRLLVDAVREVHSGGRWLDKGSSNRALERLLRRDAEGREAAPFLSPREIEIVRMVALGLRNRSIAEQLFITEGTVKIHLHNIYQKLEVGGRLELSCPGRSGLVAQVTDESSARSSESAGAEIVRKVSSRPVDRSGLHARSLPEGRRAARQTPTGCATHGSFRFVVRLSRLERTRGERGGL